MNSGPLSIIDRLSATSATTKYTGSPCGVIGSFMVLATLIWMYIWTIYAYASGLYFQSSIETQAAPYQTLQIPYDAKMAVVFINKTSNSIANHTALTTFMSPRLYSSNSLGNPQYYESSTSCDHQYFSDAINPVHLSDCYIFTPNKAFIYSYVNTANIPFSLLGFNFQYRCLNPFACTGTGGTLVSVKNDLVSLFTNYSAIFYFSTRVLQPDGSTKHQVYYISSGQFNTPYTLSANFDAEVVLSNITVDISMMPWTSMKYILNLDYYGISKSQLKNSTNVFPSALPRFDLIAANYQNQVFRYYKKEDWLLGIIGGGLFIIITVLGICCQHFSQSYYRINAAEELLLSVNSTQEQKKQTTLQKFQIPRISYWYFLMRFTPGYQNQAIKAMTQLMDISNILRSVNKAERNLMKSSNGHLYEGLRYIDFSIALPQREGEQLPKQQQQQQQQPNRINEEDKSTFKEPIQRVQLNLPKDFNFANLEEENSKENKNKVNAEKQEFLEQQNNNEKQQTQKEYIVKNQQPVKKNEKLQVTYSQYEKQELQIIQFSPFQFQSIIKQNDQKSQSQKQLQYNLINGQEKRSKLDEKPLSAQLEKKSQKNDPIKLSSDSQPNKIIIIDNQQQIIPEYNSESVYQQQSKLFGYPPEVLKAIKNSENTKHLLQNYPTIMHLTNNQSTYSSLMEDEQYNDEPLRQQKSKLLSFFDSSFEFIRLFDYFNVKIQFNTDSASSSWVGVFFTLIIIALPCLQLFNLVQLSATSQVMISKDFLLPSQIDYTLIVGKNFRPAVCFSSDAYYSIFDNQVKLQFYTYSLSGGYKYLTPVNLQSGDYQTLGITPSSIYYGIQTSQCFVPPDDTIIPMGGYNTQKQAYFGMRIIGYCQGTVAYCQSVQSSTNTNLLNFLNTDSNSFTLYTPINQYNHTLNTVYTGEIFANALRQGTTNFATTNSIEQTIYINRIQLLDDTSKRFVGISPPVIQEAVCTNRFQLGEVTKLVKTPATDYLYYDLKIRPSGNLTKVYLTGSTLDVLMGLIGGVYFICLAAFYCFGQSYNEFNVRMKLAEDVYEQRVYSKYSSFHKLFYLFLNWPLKLFRCQLIHYKSKRMELLDQKIKQDLVAIEIVKTAYSCSKLSAIPYENLLEKLIVQIFFKENANIPKQKAKETLTDFQDNFYEDEEQKDEKEMLRGSDNRVMNTFIPETSMKDQQQEQEQSQKSVQEPNQIEIQINNRQLIQKYTILPHSEYKDKKLTMSQRISCFDIFRTGAQFSLRGEWRVRSIFGSLLTFLSAAVIYIIFSYYITNFNNGVDYLISYDRSMLVNPENTPPIQFNTSKNFRASFGFYSKPDFFFRNISSIINDSASSVVGISIYQDVLTWRNSSLIISQIKYDLIPCPSDYFDGFMNPNDDPTYFSSFTNGFCLPYNITLNLSSNIKNNSQFFRVSVYNKTSSGSITLQSLTSLYPFGIYMSIPIINLQNKSFSYKVQQIRPNSEVLSKAYSVNVTLTRQAITFTTPNYTINQNSTTLQTYNYLEDRSYEFANTFSPTTIARGYNISFSHSGLRQSYKMIYPSISQLFGYLGGIAVIVITILGCIARSFNNFKRDYLVGKELYVFLIRKQELIYDESFNNFGEFDLFKAWLISYPAMIFSSYNWGDSFEIINNIQEKAKSDLDIINFYKKLARVRETINSIPAYRLSYNKNILLTDIFEKKIISQTQHHDYIKNGRFYPHVKAHELSSKAQFKLTRDEDKKDNMKINKVFDQTYLNKIILRKKGKIVKKSLQKFEMESKVNIKAQQQVFFEQRQEQFMVRSQRKQVEQQGQKKEQVQKMVEQIFDFHINNQSQPQKPSQNSSN